MSYQRLYFPHLESRLSPAPVAPGHGPVAIALKRALGKLSAPLAAWNRQQLAAARLRALDGHMLADIGLSRTAAGLGRADIEDLTGHQQPLR